MMKLYYWLADKLFYVGTSTSKRTLDINDEQELNLAEPVLIFNSKSKNLGRATLIILAFTAMGIGANYFEWSFTAAGYRINEWWIGSLIGIVIAISPMYKGILNKPVISMDQARVKSERFGTLNWAEIDKIEIENVIDDLDDHPFLLIRIGNKHYRTSLDDLSMSQQKIEKIVATLWLHARKKSHNRVDGREP